MARSFQQGLKISIMLLIYLLVVATPPRAGAAHLIASNSVNSMRAELPGKKHDRLPIFRPMVKKEQTQGGAFGSFAVFTNRIDGLDRWRNMLKRASSGCETECPGGWHIWADSIAKLSGLSRHAQLQDVNWISNSVLTYRSDLKAHGVADYWAAPLEALSSGGDCEDYVALKYLALRQAGFPEKQMRIIVLNDKMRGKPHAVLVAELDGKRYVLDNLFDDLRLDSEMTAYQPLYSFNGLGKWIHVEVRKYRAPLKIATPTLIR